MTFNQKVELAAILSGGGWSLTTVLLFAGGKTRAAYTMLAIGTIITTSLALIRAASAPGAALPGDLDLAREV